MHILTTDIYEGAYLLSQGMQLEKLWLNGKKGPEGSRASNGVNRRSVVFEFVGPQVELLRKDYQKGRASANVTKLKQSITELKDRMFSLLRSAESCGGSLLRACGEQSRTTVETPSLQAATGQAERRENHGYQLSNI